MKPVVGFDMIKAAYTKKRKDAELRGDEATVALVGKHTFPSSFIPEVLTKNRLCSHALLRCDVQLDRAYDEIMMAQLTKRKKGETSGSFKVYIFQNLPHDFISFL